MADPDWVSVGSGFVGVLAGGAITFFIERHFRIDERKRLRSERIARLHRFTGLVFNEGINLYRQVLANVPERFEGPMWRYIRPLVGGDPTPVSYNMDDISVTGGPQFDGVSAQMVLIAARRNSIVATLTLYNSLRPRLTEALAPFTTLDRTGIATTDVAYRQNSTIVMLEHEVESLAQALSKELTDLYQMIYAIIDDYNAMLAKLGGPKNRASLTLPER